MVHWCKDRCWSLAWLLEAAPSSRRSPRHCPPTSSRLPLRPLFQKKNPNNKKVITKITISTHIAKYYPIKKYFQLFFLAKFFLVALYEEIYWEKSYLQTLEKNVMLNIWFTNRPQCYTFKGLRQSIIDASRIWEVYNVWHTSHPGAW